MVNLANEMYEDNRGSERNNGNKKAEVVKLEVKKGDWEHLNPKQILREKQIFIDNYFEVGLPLRAKNDMSINAINRLWGKYGDLFEDKDYFIGEVAASVANIVLINFNDSQETYNYSEMNVPGQFNSRLHAYIVKASNRPISALESEIMKCANFLHWQKRSGKNINTFDMAYLDEESYGEGGEIYSRHEMFSEESSIFYNRQGYVATEEDASKWEEHSQYNKPHFKLEFERWFERQKMLRGHKSRNMRESASLINSQIQYFEVMRELFIGELVSDVKDDDLNYAEQLRVMEAENTRRDKLNVNRIISGKEPLELIKIYTQSDITRYNAAIGEAFEKDYYGEFESGVTFLQMQHEEEIQVLDEFMEIRSDRKSNNNRTSQWISKNFDKRIVQEIIQSLEGEDVININTAKVSNKKLLPIETLANFKAGVDAKYAAVAKTKGDRLYEKVSFKKHDAEFIEGSREEAMSEKVKRDLRYKKLTQTPVHVYKNGELVEVIEFKDQPKKKSYKIKRTLPNGMVVELDILDDDNYF